MPDKTNMMRDAEVYSKGDGWEYGVIRFASEALGETVRGYISDGWECLSLAPQAYKPYADGMTADWYIALFRRKLHE